MCLEVTKGYLIDLQCRFLFFYYILNLVPNCANILTTESVYIKVHYINNTLYVVPIYNKYGQLYRINLFISYIEYIHTLQQNNNSSYTYIFLIYSTNNGFYLLQSQKESSTSTLKGLSLQRNPLIFHLEKFPLTKVTLNYPKNPKEPHDSYI